MKAYEVTEFGIDKLSIADREMPKPKSADVVIRFRAASLNYRDLMVVQGTYNPRMKLPAVPLSDGAGEIVEIGDSVRNWKVGDRVMPLFAQRWLDGELTDEKRRTSLGAGGFWDGVLREFGAFHEDSVVKIPDHLNFDEAATLPCVAVTAWHALAVSGHLKAGDTVLTLGTGGVSVFAVQLAKLFGARVVATSSSEEKLERLRSIGADEVVNYSQLEDWDKVVRDLTGGRGVDHVVEVGGAGTLERSIRAVRFGGHIALIGALSHGSGIDPVDLFMKTVRLQGIYVGSREMFEDMNRAVELARLRPVVDRTFAFDEAREAMEYMKSGSHFGKIVIKF